MLDEGAASMTRSASATRRGARRQSGCRRLARWRTAYLSALTDQLDPSLDLFADMLRSPRFEQAEIDRIRASWIAGIKQEKARPNSAALRVLPPLLYGEGHAYAIPFTGSGTEASIASLTPMTGRLPPRLGAPEKATLVIVGDTTLKQIVPLLEKHLGD